MKTQSRSALNAPPEVVTNTIESASASRGLVTSIVIPTYQERENLPIVIERLAAAMGPREYEIVVVDDSSPDGTADVGEGLSNKYPIRVVRRPRKLGLGSAIVHGFEHSRGDIIGVIDADLQHPPELVAALVGEIEQGHDIVIASRYVQGGAIENWTLLRRIVSGGATFVAKALTPVKDPMSGFFFARREAIERARFRGNGYKVLLCMLAINGHCSIREVPYTFGTRQAGRSKLGAVEYARYLALLLVLYASRVRLALSSSKRKALRRPVSHA